MIFFEIKKQKFVPGSYKQNYIYSPKRKPRNKIKTHHVMRHDGQASFLYKGFFMHNVPSIFHGLPMDISFSSSMYKYDHKGVDIDNIYMSPPPDMFKINNKTKYQMDVI